MLSVVSYSFKNAPVELRERLALSTGEAARLLPELRSGCGLRELMVLSTCNRVEYYFVAEQRADGFAALLDWMRERYPEGEPALDTGAVRLGGHEALVHLMRVACSLESMVVGEPQILGQLKDAYHLAVEAGTAGAVLTGLLPRVFRAAKRVRTETDIARYAVSVSYVAVELAARIFDSLAEKTVMVIGAGEMAELALSHLMKAGMHRLLLANRTYANAVALGEQYGGAVVPYEQLGQRMGEADIVITSTGAKGYIITREMAREASRKRRGEPVFFIDIAVPRDVEPTVNDLPDVYCYDIDDLKAVADSNLQEREREAANAQGIVEQDVLAYERWQQSLAVVPTVKALRQTFSETARRELEPALGRLGHLTAEDRAQVQRLVHGVVNKLLHAPSTRLKKLAEEQDSTLYAEALSALFELEVEIEAAQELDCAPCGLESAEPAANAEPDNVVHLPARPRTRP